MVKRNIDWESIEKEYRAGQISIKAIGREYGLTDTAIKKHATKFGWERNLQDRIKDRVREKVVCGLREVCEPGEISEEQIVEEAANRTLQVIDVHRKYAEAHREQVGDLLDLLKYDIKRHIHCEDGPSLKDLSIVARNLSGSLDTLVNIERKSYGLDDKKDGDDKEGQNVFIIENMNEHEK